MWSLKMLGAWTVEGEGKREPPLCSYEEVNTHAGWCGCLGGPLDAVSKPSKLIGSPSWVDAIRHWFVVGPCKEHIEMYVSQGRSSLSSAQDPGPSQDFV